MTNCLPVKTCADVVVDGVGASCVVDTGVGSTFVDVNLAVDAFEAGVVAHTGVGVDSVLTEAAVQARATLIGEGTNKIVILNYTN